MNRLGSGVNLSPDGSPAEGARSVGFGYFGAAVGVVPMTVKQVSTVSDSEGLLLEQVTDLMIQRIVDLIVATTALVAVGVAMLIVAVLIRLDSPGPVFFVQERLGRYRRPFKCIKFRTMRDNAERDIWPTWSAKDDPRITGLGRILRQIRIDELPQLFNVLRGEMAIVGPRPIRQCFADQLAALEPQVSLDYPSTVEAQLEKLEYDLLYISNRSLWLDLRIMLLTCGVVFRRGGV